MDDTTLQHNENSLVEPQLPQVYVADSYSAPVENKSFRTSYARNAYSNPVNNGAISLRQPEGFLSSISIMYMRSVQSIGGVAVKSAIPSHATRRSMGSPTLTKPTTPIRSFQSIGRSKEQAEPAEASTLEKLPRQGLWETPLPFPMPETTVSQSLVPQTQHTQYEASQSTALPIYHRGALFDREPYWQKIARWSDVSEKEFLSYRWQVRQNYLSRRLRLTRTYRYPEISRDRETFLCF